MKKLLHPLTRLLLAVGLSAFSVVAFAQKTAVNGIVTDAEGAPLASILVWILLIVIAVVIPNYVRYRMEQKHSNDSVPTQNPARSAPRKKKRSKKR